MVLVILSEHGSAYVAALAIIQLVMLLGAFLLFRATRASLDQESQRESAAAEMAGSMPAASTQGASRLEPSANGLLAAE